MARFGRAVFALTLSLVSLALTLLVLMLLANQHAVEGGSLALKPYETSPDQQVTILVDDFEPQPIQGHDFWFYNRLGGDRGPIRCSDPPTVTVTWGRGLVTATITTGTNTCAGVWTSLNHPLTDCIPLSFSAIFPPQIKPQYQGQVTGLQIHILDGLGTFQVQLQIGKPSYCPAPQTPIYTGTETLTGGEQYISFSLPPTLGEVTNLNWQVIGGSGDFVVVDRVELTTTLPLLEPRKRAFLWSYAMLLSNWDPESGLTRDHAHFKANEFDNVSASGLQAAAAVMAWRLEFISKTSATEIVSKTTQGLLALPRCHGLRPHFAKNMQIVSGTEWSSIDTTIAAIALLEAREALDLDPKAVEQVLTGIEWSNLTTNGNIIHGYVTDCSRLIQEGDTPAVWKDFGTESWVVNLGYAAATGNVAEFDHTPPTWNGGGFIDELAWLLVPPPCRGRDQWTDWGDYRQRAANCQLAYYRCQEAEAAGCSCCTDTVCPVCQGWIECQDPAANCSCCRDHPCYGPLELFGLTPNEVPDLSIVPPDAKKYYLDFGVCGEGSCIDGTDPVTFYTSPTSTVVVSLGHAVIVPHYAGIIALLRPTRAISLWNWIETEGLFTPLNNVESLMFTDEVPPTNGITCTQIIWNARKGSWELGLQTLGWGRLLAGNDNPLYQGFLDNDMLRRSYRVMCLDDCKRFLPIILKE